MDHCAFVLANRVRKKSVEVCSLTDSYKTKKKHESEMLLRGGIPPIHLSKYEPIIMLVKKFIFLKLLH